MTRGASCILLRREEAEEIPLEWNQRQCSAMTALEPKARPSTDGEVAVSRACTMLKSTSTAKAALTPLLLIPTRRIAFARPVRRLSWRAARQRERNEHLNPQSAERL